VIVGSALVRALAGAVDASGAWDERAGLDALAAVAAGLADGVRGARRVVA
jgi:tryptophan synthase alpha chain